MMNKMDHPIAYDCGCVYVYEVDERGWLLKDKRNHTELISKPCKYHLQEIIKLGVWK